MYLAYVIGSNAEKSWLIPPRMLCKIRKPVKPVRPVTFDTVEPQYWHISSHVKERTHGKGLGGQSGELQLPYDKHYK